MLCSYEGCESKAVSWRMCQKHYQRVKKYGSPDIVHKGGHLAKPLVDRFWALVNIGATNECWLWRNAAPIRGYTTFHLYTGSNKPTDGRQQTIFAHRMAYILTYGPIPKGFEVDHLCRNPACINPAHLEAVTRSVNWLRSDTPSAVNARKTHCLRGHLFEEANIWHSPSKPTHRWCRACFKVRADSKRYHLSLSR